MAATLLLSSPLNIQAVRLQFGRRFRSVSGKTLSLLLSYLKPPTPLDLWMKAQEDPPIQSGYGHEVSKDIFGDSPPSGDPTMMIMDKYENMGLVGEGSYGLVMKCRHRESGQIVAIKKFLESEDDYTVKKIALREIRMLKKLRHENLVNLIEVFRRRRRLYLVFEFVDHTVLDELEQNSNGLDEDRVRQHSWQVLRALDFCHSHNIIHRDIKPENVLVSKLGVVKLCDFGFARTLIDPNESCTDYVATRWYRAPELLVGDTKYGKEVDIWALGCLFAEMLTGDPLFPGESDIDQVFYIMSYLGPLSMKHQELIEKNPIFQGMNMNTEREIPATKKLAMAQPLAIEFFQYCLQLDPIDRPTCLDLLNHRYFTWDRFPERFIFELKQNIQQEFRSNPLLRRPSNVGSSRRAGQPITDDWKNRKIRNLMKETVAEDPKNTSKVFEPENLSSISSPLKIRLSPPRLMPAKMAPLVMPTSKGNKPLSPKNDMTITVMAKDLLGAAIPPINQNNEVSGKSSPPNNSDSSLIVSPSNLCPNIGNFMTGNAQITFENSKHPFWITDKPKKASNSLLLKKSTSDAGSHTASGLGGSILNSLLQGERSQLHDKSDSHKVMLARRKARAEFNIPQSNSKLLPSKDDFSLPDVPGAAAYSPSRGRGQKKPGFIPAKTHITTLDPFPHFQNDNFSPPNSAFGSGLPFV